MQPAPRSTWHLSRRLFTSGIALVFAIAFGSLGVQVRGLYGSHGIAPLAERLRVLGESLEGSARLQLPSLFWLACSDDLLVGATLLGIAFALLALLGLLPRYALAACWLLYLSFVSVGSPFLDFQWDALLLEAGLLAVLYAPGGWLPYRNPRGAPSTLARWLVYLLLFKLMFLSGVVKLNSGDPSWRDGSALAYHFWTQPLPHRLSVHAARVPGGLLRASTYGMLAIEIVLPFGIFLPFGRRRLRQLVAAGTAGLMLVIFLTGNYGFFNLLTAVLCIPLLDDRAWRRLLPRPGVEPPEPPARSGLLALPWPGVRVALALPIALVSTWQILEGASVLHEPPEVLESVRTRLAPYRCVNSYGLFRVMTKERPELLIEGSNDGVRWQPYRFRYKPGELERAPVFAGLHMPRLDWQLWFAALEAGSARRSRWVVTLVERLLEGSPEVLALLGPSPFPEGPPREIRVLVAPYRFAGSAKRAGGLWWQHEAAELYLPPRARER